MSTRFLVLLFAVITVVASQASNPVVRVTQGLLSGTWSNSSDGRTFAAFLGVPYARPPVGKYRFREPQQLKPWPGVWDATHHLSGCLQPQYFSKQITGSENCLYLNVYTPQLTAGASLPVVVLIHGGAFMRGGSSDYDPTYLMDRDLVVVTLNYRLGPLGFLSTGDEVIPGNFGLKDQVFALSWVKSNIMLFGGNPDSVTLTGTSAGGASVHYHYLSPLSKGMFTRGIAFSGSAFASWAYAVKPAQKAKALAALVGCPTDSSRKMADCLQYRSAQAITRAHTDMFEWNINLFSHFTPTAEAPAVRQPFLTQYPYHAAQAGQMHRVPLITSVTSEEGLYPAAAYQANPNLLPELESRWEWLASNIFEFNDTLPVNQRAEVAAKIKQRYLGGRPVSQETFGQLVQALSDRLFVSNVGRLAQTHALMSGQPVYLYRYSFRGAKSLSNLLAGNKNNYGVCHFDDVSHIVEFSGLEPEEDKKMTQTLLDLVYSYSTNGTPKVGAVDWSPVSPGSPELQYLEIASPTKLEMKSSSDFGQRSFWDSLGFKENENFMINDRDD